MPGRQKGGFMARLFPCLRPAPDPSDPSRAERARLAKEIEASALGLDPPDTEGEEGGKKKRKKRRIRLCPFPCCCLPCCCCPFKTIKGEKEEKQKR